MKSVDQPLVQVGILSSQTIRFCLSPGYFCLRSPIQGECKVICEQGKILWNGSLYEELIFEPVAEADSFVLHDVIIGKQFHWERKEDQRFIGSLKFIVEGDEVTAINELPVEAYLQSVISSEMSADASSELLKAHAVISRSWLLYQMRKSKVVGSSVHSSFIQNKEELIRWQDREDHLHFDVCADDHCQRYQGVTRISTPQVIEAVSATCGEVLMYDDEICDARFSKSCGGVLEQFSTCWEDEDYPYLQVKRDTADKEPIPDLTKEDEARKWISSSPDSFCNTSDKRVLRQVLNNYDQETNHFYRWVVTYSQLELSELVKNRSLTDYGIISDLIPIQRGPSGRLIKLEIVGSKKKCIIGKELEIRHTLSASHLYSSAFFVEKEQRVEGLYFILHGAGWGHGVGLCQIGAAVMGEKGYTYDAILYHYYPHAQISKLYK